MGLGDRTYWHLGLDQVAVHFGWRKVYVQAPLRSIWVRPLAAWSQAEETHWRDSSECARTWTLILARWYLERFVALAGSGVKTAVVTGTLFLIPLCRVPVSGGYWHTSEKCIVTVDRRHLHRRSLPTRSGTWQAHNRWRHSTSSAAFATTLSHCTVFSIHITLLHFLYSISHPHIISRDNGLAVWTVHC